MNRRGYPSAAVDESVAPCAVYFHDGSAAKEAADGTVSIRLRDGSQLPAMKIAAFAAYAVKKIETKDLEL